MNYPKILSYTCLLVGIILFGCNNSTSEKTENIIDSEGKIAEELGKAVTHTSLSDVTPLTVEELEAWLPQSLNGMERTGSQPGSMSRSGVSGISATYGNPYKKSIVILVTDGAGALASAMGLVGGYRRQINADIDRVTEGGYSKTVTNKGVKAIESHTKHDSSYNVTTLFGDRFGIELRSTRISLEEAWQAYHALPLEGLLK